MGEHFLALDGSSLSIKYDMLKRHGSDPSGPVNPLNFCIFVAVLYFPVFCFCVLYFPVFLVDCTIVVVDLCFHYILLLRFFIYS